MADKGDEPSSVVLFMSRNVSTMSVLELLCNELERMIITMHLLHSYYIILS